MSEARITQTESGKAWEYGLALQCSDMLNRHEVLEVSKASEKCKESYGLLSEDERERVDQAANEAIVFLRHHDPRLLHAKRISMQSDMKGGEGDVRDILIHTNNEETIGISAKHRHNAIKHSRLSPSIDFGKDWYDNPCSEHYWQTVRPIFDCIKKREGQLWQDFPEKHKDIYAPLLGAFIEEVKRNADPSKMLRYLLGRYDFYKVIKENGNISLQSFNMNKTLKWGSPLPLPNRIIESSKKPGSSTTAIITFDHGWQVSFRIHNANKWVELSLKFDVTLIGTPSVLSRHEIPLDQPCI